MQLNYLRKLEEDMNICDHVTEKCFEPVGAWKEPCPHAITHEWSMECLGGQCHRFAHEVENNKLAGVIFVKHVEI